MTTQNLDDAPVIPTGARLFRRYQMLTGVTSTLSLTLQMADTPACI